MSAQSATRSSREVLNARRTGVSPAVAEHYAAHRRAFWLREARRSLRLARSWTERFGGPLHDFALGEFLDWILNADLCRRYARGERVLP